MVQVVDEVEVELAVADHLVGTVATAAAVQEIAEAIEIDAAEVEIAAKKEVMNVQSAHAKRKKLTKIKEIKNKQRAHQLLKLIHISNNLNFRLNVAKRREKDWN